MYLDIYIYIYICVGIYVYINIYELNAFFIGGVLFFHDVWKNINIKVNSNRVTKVKSFHWYMYWLLNICRLNYIGFYWTHDLAQRFTPSAPRLAPRGRTYEDTVITSEENSCI